MANDDEDDEDDEDTGESEEEGYFAKAQWHPDDIKDLRPNWSKKKCREWLIENQGAIQDRMIEAGWEVIEDLLN